MQLAMAEGEDSNSLVISAAAAEAAAVGATGCEPPVIPSPESVIEEEGGQSEWQVPSPSDGMDVEDSAP